MRGFDRHDFGDPSALHRGLKLQGRLSIAGSALGGRGELRAHNRPRDPDRIGERLGADKRRPDVDDTRGVLAVDAIARAVRFERAFIEQDSRGRAVRQGERDRRIERTI